MGCPPPFRLPPVLEQPERAALRGARGDARADNGGRRLVQFKLADEGAHLYDRLLEPTVLSR